MQRFRMLDILKRIGTGIILSLFAASAYEDSFALAIEHYFSENSRQSAVATADNDSGGSDSYDACGNQHSGHLPCETSCQFTECRNVAIVPWKGTDWKKYGIKWPSFGTVAIFRLPVSELTKNPDLRCHFSGIPDKNSYANLVGIVKNLN